MGKETDKFLSLYRTYENLLREHGTDYRAVEEKQTGGRMTMMRQMRNYLAHSEDPGFIAVSPLCLRVLEDMVKEEMLKGDIVKKHLVTPAKGSIKEGMTLSEIVYWMSKTAMSGVQTKPVYNEHTSQFKGLLMLERAAYELMRLGDTAFVAETMGACMEGSYHFVKPTDPVPEHMGTDYYICTKDGTKDGRYMGYIDNPESGILPQIRW